MRVAVPIVVLLVGVGAAWWLLDPDERATSVPKTTTAAPQPAIPDQSRGGSTPRAAEPARPARPTSAPPQAVTTAISDTVRDRIQRDRVRKSAEDVLKKVAVKAPPAKTSGVMSREAVRFAINQSKPGIVDCYAQALEKTPDLAGRLVMRFTVHVKDGVGTLRDAEVVEDGLGNPFLGMCALGAVAKVEFEAEQDGVLTVNYPFNLRPDPPAPKDE